MSQVSFDDFCFCSRRLSVHTFLSLSMMKTILGNWSLQLRGNSNLQNKIKLIYFLHVVHRVGCMWCHSLVKCDILSTGTVCSRFIFSVHREESRWSRLARSLPTWSTQWRGHGAGHVLYRFFSCNFWFETKTCFTFNMCYLRLWRLFLSVS